jgi:hypothetical protein
VRRPLIITGAIVGLVAAVAIVLGTRDEPKRKPSRPTPTPTPDASPRDRAAGRDASRRSPSEVGQRALELLHAGHAVGRLEALGVQIAVERGL